MDTPRSRYRQIILEVRKATRYIPKESFMKKIIQVGAGAWGTSWIPIVRDHQEWELAGLVTSQDSVAGVPQELYFSELGDAISAVRADAVLIATPPDSHAPVAVEALEAGLHCLIEKPLADTLRSCREIIKAADQTNRQAMVSQNFRFKRTPRTVQRLIKDGAIGAVEHVRVDFQKNPPFTGFRLEMEEPLIIDQAIHHLDQLRGIVYLEPQMLRARSWNPSWSRFDGNASALIEMETEGGAQIVYTGSWVSHGKHTTWDCAWDIQGDAGGLVWSDNRVDIHFSSLFNTVFMPGALERNGVMEVQLDHLEFEERTGILAEFASAIEEARPAETSARDNLNSVALTLAAVESAKAGGKEIDLEAFKAP